MPSPSFSAPGAWTRFARRVAALRASHPRPFAFADRHTRRWPRPLALLGVSLACWLVLKFPLQLGFGSAFLLVEHVAADTRFFTALRTFGFDWVLSQVPRGRSRLSDEGPPVVIIDITRLERVDFFGRPGNGFIPADDFTPRAPLTDLVQRLATDLGAIAIGVDVDFSPDIRVHHGGSPAGNEQFLNTCLALGQGAGAPPVRLPSALPPAVATAPLAVPVPVFVGVGRGSANAEPGQWLGQTKYAPLAATILLCNDEIGLEPPLFSLAPLQVRSGPIPLPSLSSRLATAYTHAHPTRSERTPPAALQGVVVQDIFPLELNDDTGATHRVDAYYLNYREVDVLAHQSIDAELVLTGTPEQLAALRARVQGRIALVGEADFLRSTDRIIMPGQKRLVPGVYAHACGILTRLQSPLWRIHFWGVFGEAVLALLVSIAGSLVGSVIWSDLWSKGHGVRAEFFTLLITLTLALGVALALGRWWNVLWLGALSCLFASCCETALNLWLTPAPAAEPAPAPELATVS